MMPRRINQLSFFGLVVLILISIGSAVAATNTVPSSRLTDQRQAITANNLKPAACASLDLTAIVVCPSLGGPCQGTNAAELVIGSAYADTIKGGKARPDCLLGGGGDDDLLGEKSGDVCIGGPGNDTFKGCDTVIQ